MTVPQRRARVLAFYLPQYHRTPENDEWWGPGFTEWTNCRRGRPLFPGHHQPHVPGELGYYDLADPETWRAQTDLAAAHGIEGFLCWHYWFSGRTVLHKPMEALLRGPEPKFRFCLGWANQTWAGTWHGADGRTLIEQTYPGEADDRAHFEYLLPFLTDARYVAVEGRPLFYIFRPEQLPDPRAFVRRWRAMARASGLPGLYLVAEQSDLHGRGVPYSRPEDAGFDAGVYVRFPFRHRRLWELGVRAGHKLGWPGIYPHARAPLPPMRPGPVPIFPAVYPNWDNTPRAGRSGVVLVGSTPARFRAHLRDAIEAVQSLRPAERLVFVKSWNEWAEGNHLEPDARYGRGYLEAVAEEVSALPEREASTPRRRRPVRRSLFPPATR